MSTSTLSNYVTSQSLDQANSMVVVSGVSGSSGGGGVVRGGNASSPQVNPPLPRIPAAVSPVVSTHFHSIDAILGLKSANRRVDGTGGEAGVTPVSVGRAIVTASPGDILVKPAHLSHGSPSTYRFGHNNNYTDSHATIQGTLTNVFFFI